MHTRPLLITRLSSSVLVAQMPARRGPTSVKQVDMAHTGQPTSLCHLTFRLGAFKRVAVDGVLTWPLSTCTPAKVSQCPRRFQCTQAVTIGWWREWCDTDGLWPWRILFHLCYLNLLASHGTTFLCGMVAKITFLLKVLPSYSYSYIFWIIKWWLNWSPCAFIFLHAYRPKSTKWRFASIYGFKTFKKIIANYSKDNSGVQTTEWLYMLW